MLHLTHLGILLGGLATLPIRFHNTLLHLVLVLQRNAIRFALLLHHGKNQSSNNNDFFFWIGNNSSIDNAWRERTHHTKRFGGTVCRTPKSKPTMRVDLFDDGFGW
jgi:hypothetical protein